MRLSRLVGVLLLASCGLLSTRQVTYLEQAQGHATQEEVLQEFGEPAEKRTLEEGGSELTFRYTGVSMVMLMPIDEVYCVEYVVTFDVDKILRHWLRRDCPRK